MSRRLLVGTFAVVVAFVFQTGIASAVPPGFTVVTAGPFSAASYLVSGGTAHCPAGTVVWGGGESNTSSSPDVSIASSWPFTTTSWVANVNNESPATASFSVYAVCAKQSKSWTIATLDLNTGGLPKASGTVSCPAGLHVFGGGSYAANVITSPFLGQESSYPVKVPGTTPVYEWSVQISNETSTNLVKLYAICGKGPLGYHITTGPVKTGDPGLDTGRAFQRPCKTGQVVLGGGANVTSTLFDLVMLHDSYPGPARWINTIDNTSTAPVSVSSVAICIDS